MNEVRRGEVWLVTHAGVGSEIRGQRPALVIQNDAGNHFAATTIVAAITTRVKPLPS
jgi:mRNA interferase MazF